VRIGCVFDAVEAGLATSKDPLVPADGRPWVNPGSATLPADGARAGFARLSLDAGAAVARIVVV